MGRLVDNLDSTVRSDDRWNLETFLFINGHWLSDLLIVSYLWFPFANKIGVQTIVRTSEAIANE